MPIYSTLQITGMQKKGVQGHRWPAYVRPGHNSPGCKYSSTGLLWSKRYFYGIFVSSWWQELRSDVIGVSWNSWLQSTFLSRLTSFEFHSQKSFYKRNYRHPTHDDTLHDEHTCIFYYACIPWTEDSCCAVQ